MAKFEGTPEEMIAFEKGVAAERERFLKILKKFHENFGSGPIEDSNAAMEIRYMYNFIMDTRPLK